MWGGVGGISMSKPKSNLNLRRKQTPSETQLLLSLSMLIFELFEMRMFHLDENITTSIYLLWWQILL